MMDLLFPRHCEICLKIMNHKNQTYLCEICFNKIRFISSTACCGCARVFPGAIPSIEDWMCPSCLRTKRSYDACHAVSYYEGPIKELLQTFKFARAEYLAGTLREIFMKGMVRKLDWENFDFVVPIPLHPRKLKERGFNQSYILAQTVREVTGLRILRDGIIRIKYSEGQTLQDKKARLENIRGSFEIRKFEKLQGKKIVLVDDVLTTGATIQECSRVLKEAGAESVEVLVLARSI
jgi:ComF family protein